MFQDIMEEEDCRQRIVGLMQYSAVTFHLMIMPGKLKATGKEQDQITGGLNQ